MGVVLTHEQAYNQIKDGDVMFVSNRKSIMSTLIRWATKSHFSHCAICFWVDVASVPRLMVIEAVDGEKRRMVDFEEYNKYELVIVASPKPWQLYAATALQRVGDVKYNYFEAAYVGIREFLRKTFGINIKSYNFTGEICSEFVASMLDYDSVDVSPEDVYQEILKTSEVRFTISKG